MARIVKEFDEYSFRTYVADSLFLQSKGKAFNESYTDMTEHIKNPVEEKSAEEIVTDVMQQAGLKFM